MLPSGRPYVLNWVASKFRFLAPAEDLETDCILETSLAYISMKKFLVAGPAFSK